MTASDCRHPGDLDRRADGAHCRYCNTLIYPAPTPPPPTEPEPVAVPPDAGASR